MSYFPLHNSPWRTFLDRPDTLAVVLCILIAVASLFFLWMNPEIAPDLRAW